MNLALLKGISAYLQNMEHIVCFKRKEINLFAFVCQDKQGNKQRIYFDMTRSQSNAFMSETEILGAREFNAPFDNKLAQCSTRAKIEQVRVDGENRILQIFISQKGHYKLQYFWLICEFTGKHTNVMICDENFVVLEALRHIPSSKSWRVVAVGKVLEPLPQPNTKMPPQTIPSLEQTLALLHRSYMERYTQFHNAKKQAVLKSLYAKRENLLQMLDSLPKYEELLTSAKQYAHYGKVLFGSLHLLPTHKITSSHLTLQDFEGANIELELPPCARDLQEAGNWYFTQSKKYHKKAQHLHKQIENLQDKIDFLSDKIALIKQCDELSAIFATQEKKPKAKDKILPTKDIESFFIEGFKISIGRNAKENQRLLESAKADDLWFHIKDMPSAHLIIHCGKKMPPNAVIDKSVEILVGLYAVRKGGGNFIVDYTKRRFVKLSQNAQVTYAKAQSIHYKYP
ncbi:NFACT family protein [Helicobacter sp. MIT 21-1697]|uniref:NFACT family protein n=1 Tax=Helicobacter sp. MIT 21-1697 TaxID=2993733 RepID=UPI00224B5688|nr:NFACT family protein [Helicobacter sp. MIT 21-1697]MCX2717190.1 NFACT family protein [Helicobacter sp. MIT 21-1697]